jgi:hypothetical protein
VLKKISLSSVAFALAFLVAYYLLGESAVYYEMWATGAATRVELADDFGLGILDFFIVLPASALIAFVTAWLTWRKVTRSGRSSTG